MTIKECMSRGIQSKVNSVKRWQTVNVAFLNEKKAMDETQFDVMAVTTKSGKDELSQIYENFCTENNLPADTVKNITIVCSANSYEELEYLAS